MATFNWIVIALVVIAIFLLGIVVGKYGFKAHTDGVIFLGKNEDGDDRIVFQLDMEYDDIAKHNLLAFKVIQGKRGY